MAVDQHTERPGVAGASDVVDRHQIVVSDLVANDDRANRRGLHVDTGDIVGDEVPDDSVVRPYDAHTRPRAAPYRQAAHRDVISVEPNAGGRAGDHRIGTIAVGIDDDRLGPSA